MKRALKLLAVLLLVFLLLGLAGAGWLYWRARHALPAYDGEARLSGLSAPVRILRDERAVPHLYAQNLDDLLFAQGYVHAQERMWQMDLIRRDARGELSEVFGPVALEADKDNRRLGLRRVAEQAVERLDPDSRRQLESYARGVNAYLEGQEGSVYVSGLPVEFALLRYRPAPWRASDSVAIGLRMFKLLYTQWSAELARSQIEARVGPERAADLYVSRSDSDHPIAAPVEAPARPRRPRVFTAYRCPHALGELLRTVTPEAIGASNNWVAGPPRTASGAAMLANDMHLPYTVPPIWFINHLKSPEMDVLGFSLPGVPGVIVGHNQRIAWGFTNMMVDNQDLFIERFDPKEPLYYMTPTGWQAAERRLEKIAVRGGDPVEFEVLVTRHGPVIHEDGNRKLALQWTALDPAQVALTFIALNRAQNWEEFLGALSGYGGPPQNVVYADADGNIGYHGAGRVPVRRTGQGLVPVPGETPQYDWTGFLPFDRMPQAFNPPAGVLATANNRVVPDDFPYYISRRWFGPARIARIYELLLEDRKFAPDDFLRIQGDIVSLPDRFLAGQLRAAGRAVKGHPPARAQALEALENWDGAMRAEQAAPVLTNAIRPKLMEMLLRPQLGDDWRSYSWFMNGVFLENVLRERPARWLPKGFASYDELLLAALDAALRQLQEETGVADPRGLRWGAQWRARFAHPFGDRIPLLRNWFSTGGDEQSGGPTSVKQTHRTAGVSERLVVDFADLDRTLINITLGQSGHPASPHYRDQYRAWLEVRSFPVSFSDAAVERAACYRFTIRP